MNTPEDNGDQLDALLREQNHYVDDNGFTARVMKVLPRRRRNSFGLAVKLGAVVIGSVLALRWLPLKNLPPLEMTNWFSANPNVLLPWLTVLVVAAALVWGAVSALQWED
jgi:hypothetical protein